MSSLADILLASLQPQTRQAAETSLASASKQPGFLSALLALIGDESASSNTHPVLHARFAGAIYFKNWIKKEWAEDTISEADKDAIKGALLPAMIRLASGHNGMDNKLQAQLGESVAIIASTDFPEKWEGLVDQLVASLSPTDYSINLGVLTCAHSIFSRWQSQFVSNALAKEIVSVVTKFSSAYEALLLSTDVLISSEAYKTMPGLQRLRTAQSFHLLIQLYQDMCSQDLPDYFEERLSTYMPILLKYLVSWGSDFPEDFFGDGDPDGEATELEKIRSAVCSVVMQFSMVYSDAEGADGYKFDTVVGSFVEAAWTLLTQLPQGSRYDSLVNSLMRFLSSVVRMNSRSALFAADGTLEQMCSAIILPNMIMPSSDEELFEDDPAEYIRRDMDITSSEANSRREAAAELTRALVEKFDVKVTSIIGRYIEQFLKEYNSNPSTEWKKKDTAIYLLTSIASRSSTASHGVIQVNGAVDVVDFFGKYVVSDLSTPSTHTILRVDAIKYLYTFRSQLNREQLMQVLPLLSDILQSGPPITKTYAAIAIEKILLIKNDKGMMFHSLDVKELSPKVLSAIFTTLEACSTPEQMSENDQMMKCAMRILVVSRSDSATYVGEILPRLSKILTEISKNPSNSKFSHFSFECVSSLIRFVVPSQPAYLSSFESSLLGGAVGYILQNDVTDFTPYAFQILAQMLELHPKDGHLPDSYISLLDPLLSAALWEQRGNIPALVRLLKAFISRGAGTLNIDTQIPAVLGIIFQKLIPSKFNDGLGFDILFSLIESPSLPITSLSSFTKSIWTHILTRLQTNKTPSFSQHFTCFVCKVIALQKLGTGPDFVISGLESVQPGLFGQILTNVLLPELVKIPVKDRKIVTVGMTRLISCQTFIMPPYNSAWPATMSKLLALLTSGVVVKDAAETDDILFAHDLDEASAGYQASFVKLAASEPPVVDLAPSVSDVKLNLCAELAQACGKHATEVTALLSQVPDSSVLSELAAFGKQHGVPFTA